MPSSELLWPHNIFSCLQLPNSEKPETSSVKPTFLHNSLTSPLLPLPAALVKSCLLQLLSLISSIIHVSLTTGLIPTLFESAAPILKNPCSNPTDSNNLISFLTDFFSPKNSLKKTSKNSLIWLNYSMAFVLTTAVKLVWKKSPMT